MHSRRNQEHDWRAYWKELGYTSEQVTDAFKQMLEAYEKAFPRQHLAIMTGTKSFPPIGAGGKWDDEAGNLPQTVFLQMGKQKPGRRFVGRRNSWTAFRHDQYLNEFARTSPAGWARKDLY